MRFLLFFVLAFTNFRVKAGPCLEEQLGFRRSCYEIARLPHGFQDAESWCERGGGHLAFILDEDTQEFLLGQLEVEKDWWIGLAPWKQNLTQDEVTTEGTLAWLDGTSVMYGNWAPGHQPSPTATCAYLLQNSMHHWMSTDNCSQELHFICEYESGRAFACDLFNATLQCESGEVIQIGDSFYGRKSPSYCPPEDVTPTDPQECSWIDAREKVKGQCHGLQACQVKADKTSFGDLCPGLGNYLVVDYHCKEGLYLLVDDVYKVRENITISHKWLLNPYSGNLTCTVNTGDGDVIEPYNPLESVTNITHQYQATGLFTISVECATSEWHVTAQKMVSIQQPISGFGIIKCFNANQTEDCTVRYGDPLWIQLVVEAGTNVTYVMLAGTVALHTVTAVQGTVPQNVTMDNATQGLIGAGAHQITILAKNNVTAREISRNITVQFVEPIKGLQATVNSAVLELGSDLTINISVSHGAPVELQFEFIGPNETFSESIENPDGNVGAYCLPMNSEGVFLVQGKAVNALSSISFNVGNITVVARTSALTPHDNDGRFSVSLAASSNKTNDGADIPSPQTHPKTEAGETLQLDSLQAKVTGSRLEAADPFSQLLLSGRKSRNNDEHDYSKMAFHWSCGACWPLWNICTRSGQMNTDQQDLTIIPACLPPPNSFISVRLTVSAPGKTNSTAEKCLVLNKGGKRGLDVRVRCENNCNPVDPSENVTLTVSCQECKNSIKYNWYRVKPSNSQVNLPSACNIKQQSSALESLALMKENTDTLVLGKEELAKYGPTFKVRAVGISGYGCYKYNDYMVSMVPPLPVPSCDVSPNEGSAVSTEFSIKCTVACGSNSSCNSSDLTYCFFVKPDFPLHCGSQPILPPTYLPLGDSKNNDQLNIIVTVSDGLGSSTSVIIAVMVHGFSDIGENKDLATLFSENLMHLSEKKANSSSLIRLFESVSSVLNQEAGTGGSDKLALTDKKKLREMMLSNLAVVEVPSLHRVLEVSEVLKQLTAWSNELTSTSQLEASATLQNMGASLLTVGDEEPEKRMVATKILFNVVNNVLEALIETDEQDSTATDTQRVVSEMLLDTINHLQVVALNEAIADDEPILMTMPSVRMYLQRLPADSMEGDSIRVSDPALVSFTLPALPWLSSSGDMDSVDVRMVSFSVNPFAWTRKNEVSGAVSGLVLTSSNGTVHPVRDLLEHIEIILPRYDVTPENRTEFKLENELSTMQVNVTAESGTLGFYLETEQDVPLLLYLSYATEPNDTSFLVSTQLPNTKYTGAARYTWLVPLDELMYGAGIYYLAMKPIPDLNSSQLMNTTVAFTSFVSQCVYWDEVNSNWNSSGCLVGPLTTLNSTQCLCNHLTFFSSSFFVMPNVVDVSKTVELFATFVDNPIVVTTVACVFGLYILAVAWARSKDQQDVTKVKITLLADNDPFAQYRYLVTIFTGHRRGAATTSKVTITLHGSERESDPHFLTDVGKPTFERGGVDGYLLTTLFPLGDLQSIRLWHDNSGSNPSWYANRVTVLDLETDQRWSFLCNSWLAIDVDDCLLDKVFPVATEMDLKRFSNLFFMKTAKDFRDSHIWYSVLNRPPRSPFTRVQRVSCCFSLLLCTMLTSIIFWGVPKDPAQQKMDLGKIEFTWQEVVIGFESSLLMFPINLLIVQIFRNIRPRSKGMQEKKQGKHGRISPSLPSPPASLQSCSLTPEAVIKNIQRIANSLTKTLKSPQPTLDMDLKKTTDINKLLALVENIIREQNKVDGEFYHEGRKKVDTLILSLGSVDLQEPVAGPDSEKGATDKQRRSDYNHHLYLQLQRVESELGFLGSSKFENPQSYTQAVHQVQHMKDLLENVNSCSSSVSESFSTIPSLSGDTKKGHCSKGLPWWFVFIGWGLVAASSGVSAFFTMLYGLHYGKDSSIKWLISMAISFFESILITQPLKVLGFAAFFALVLKKVEPEDEGESSIDSPFPTSVVDPSVLLAARRDSSSNIYQPPPQKEVEHMKRNLVKEQKVCGLIKEILAYFGFMWMLLLVAYGQRDPNSYYLNKAIQNSFTSGFDDILSYQSFFKWANSTLISNLFGFYPGFVTDGNSKLVGSARIRQLRIKNIGCRIPAKLRSTVEECHGQYSLDNEDMSVYGLHWNMTAVQNSSNLDYIWQYKSQSELRSYPVWGKLAMYRGGGYVAELGADAQDAYRVLQYMFDNSWLDTYTRAIFVEFTVYNANVNLFCIATLILESNAVGPFFTHADFQSIRLYQYTDGLHIFVVAAEVVYFLFLIYYMVIQGKLLKEQKWNYFKSKWNLLEAAIIMISWSALSIFIKRTILGKRDIEYYHNHRSGFVSFYETAMADAAMGYLIAFLVLLATIKLWHLLRLNPKLNMITSTLRRAWGDISGFLTVILIMFLAYSIATNLMFGWTMSSYKTIFDAAETMISLQMGIFNYEEVLDYNPILGSFLIGSCIIFMTFVVLNLFISVILVAFSEEQKNYKASEEEEIVDLMLTKVCSFLGIKSKKDSSKSRS
ncbi:polycystic kidney disease protein 1-like 2 [Amblyraja radiata]|uniref:polycystic kidney disease protein 1-like 2 n=1 Tax=Amblyraja radiata TaxID=386614 RepID=UPI001403D2A2|nr:polycystic kidney disease protein 1-like 2 [Amblyraja radiata]